MYKKIVLPFIITLFLVFIIGTIFEKFLVLNSSISGAAKVNTILNKNKKHEIAIIGSSRANSSYIPSILGSQYHNYGIDGTSMNVHLKLLNAELHKDKTTPIIFNLDYNIWGNGTGDINNYIPCATQAVVKELLGDKYKFYFSIPSIKYYGNYEHYIRYYLNERMQLTKIIDNGASLETNKLSKAEFAKLINKRLNSKTKYNRNVYQFNTLNATIKDNPHRHFIFVIAPYHISAIQSFENKKEFYNDVNELTKHANSTLLDYSNFELGDSKFLNTTHLNYDGAILFSEALKDTLCGLLQ
ncbi:hypothetical protein [Saccharicrinis aurantiacus]|uniref:hypothetical protein n=1 Tax=Saccharicrinis aurantiacus TaxID=1849719 RepID=UPI0024926BB6|nr:hypothetical protein [Saccharicrinis aurantiacus]